MLAATHENPTPRPLSMPELPEVETVRRGLLPVLEGKRIAKLDQNRKDLRFPLPADFAARVRGRKIERLERRAKYLLAHLSGGDVLLMHLGMTGRFTVHAPASGPERVGKYVHETGADRKHDHVVFHMEQGATVTYNDARRFGFMLLIPEAELKEHPLMHGLGVEPLSADLSPEYLARRAAGKKVDLKAFLVGPAHRRGSRQHLRVRGSVPRRPIAPAQGRDDCYPERPPNGARREAGGGHPRRAQGRDRRRRLVLARLPPRRRRARRIPAHVRGLWPRGQAMRAQRLPRHCQAHRAVGALDVLLPQVSALRPAQAGAGRRVSLR